MSKLNLERPNPGDPDIPAEEFLEVFGRLASQSEIVQEVFLAGAQDYSFLRSGIEVIVVYHEYGAMSVVFKPIARIYRELQKEHSRRRVTEHPNKRLVVVDEITPQLLFEVLEQWWDT